MVPAWLLSHFVQVEIAPIPTIGFGLEYGSLTANICYGSLMRPAARLVAQPGFPRDCANYLPGVCFACGRAGSVHIYNLPLWVIMLAALLLYRQPKLEKPECCKNCDYDLTGNVSGICPECGHVIRSADHASTQVDATYEPQRGP